MFDSPDTEKSGKKKKTEEEKKRKEEKRRRREASENKARIGSSALSAPDSPDSPIPTDHEPLVLPKRNSSAKTGRRGSIGASGSAKPNAADSPSKSCDPLVDAFKKKTAPVETAASTAASLGFDLDDFGDVSRSAS